MIAAQLDGAELSAWPASKDYVMLFDALLSDTDPYQHRAQRLFDDSAHRDLMPRIVGRHLREVLA